MSDRFTGQMTVAVDAVPDMAMPPARDNDISMRVLQTADQLVREGLAVPHGTQIRICLPSQSRPLVHIDVPLPPAELCPVLSFQTPDMGGDIVQRETFCRAVKNRVAAALPGPVRFQIEDGRTLIRWLPAVLNMEEDALNRLRAVGEHVALLMQAVLSGTPAKPALAELTHRLSDHQDRGAELGRIFAEHCIVRLPGHGHAHLLASVPGDVDEPRLLVVQSDSGLLSQHTGRGFQVGLRLPPQIGVDQTEQLATRLFDVLAHRCSLALTTSDAFEILDPDWGDVDTTILMSAVPDATLTFESFVDAVRDLVRFLRSFIRLVRDGLDPLDLLGRGREQEWVERPVAVTPTKETISWPEIAQLSGQAVPGRPLTSESDDNDQDDLHEPTLVDFRPDLSAATDNNSDVGVGGGVDDGALTTAITAVPDGRGRLVTQRPARPAPQRPKPSTEPFKKLTAREVVARLGGGQTADMDVFMTHPGYNPNRTSDIMAIMLSIPKAEALELCEKSPVLLVGPVTRARAAKVKTILSGTGATINVVPHESD